MAQQSRPLSAGASFAVVLATLTAPVASAAGVQWYAPASSNINNLDKVINGSGVYGFIYNSSTTPDNRYGTYNWCNMPHVRKKEYVKVNSDYELQYVELVSDIG